MSPPTRGAYRGGRGERRPSAVIDAPAVVAADPASASGWARSAAVAALHVPAVGWEADEWAIRGLADVALGCALMDGTGAYAELDDVVRSAGITAGGPAADRLRRLRALAGPVPPYYPQAMPLPGGRAAPDFARRAAELLSQFCAAVAIAAAEPRCPSAHAAWPDESRAQLQWGERYRPSATDAEVVVIHPNLPKGLMRRSWLRLPRAGDVATVLVERRAYATPIHRLVGRGIHDGAHLDHIGALTKFTVAAPSPAEFGHGLALAETYAMAVEITATVGCLLDGETSAARVLGSGLIERIGRLTAIDDLTMPSGPPSATEFTALPTLAEAYVVKPLLLLGGATPGPLLPGDLTRPLLRRWDALCAAFPAAARLTAAAQELTG